MNFIKTTENTRWSILPDDDVIDKTITSLRSNGFDVIVAKNKEEAKLKMLALIPPGSDVTAGASVTLETIGVKDEIDESGKYVSHRKKTKSLDRKTQQREIKTLRSIATFGIGSVHAITQDGKILIASQTGSQLPSYAYGADHVIWVAGTQKIVDNLDDGIKRIYEYCLPLEDTHMHELYNMGSSVNKILIVNKEPLPGRTTLILVKEVLGF